MSPTDEQLRVIERPADSRTLVIAPAGSGKTYTLVRRLDHLLGQGLSSGEILMLSFSRAAVHELRNRTETANGGFVSANTFDAWALMLLNRLYPGEDWRSLSFDERIREATGAVRDGHTVEYNEAIRHVLLDEVQDLVGVRRDLVEALLESLDRGFTMVGDPAQAIYGFQSGGHTTGPDVFARVRTRYADDLVELSLTRDFRARSPRPEGLVRVGAALRSASVAADLPTLVRSEFLDVPEVGRLTDIAGGLQYLDGNCAILCGDNGQALEASGTLRKEGVAHRLQRRAGDTAAPRWLASVIGDGDGNIDRETFAERTDLADGALDTAWEALLSIAPTSSGRRLDRTRLRNALARGRLPRQVTAPAYDRVTISSMHRAKGLEWDRVYLIARRRRDDEDAMEEARLLYMAMTRWRDDVYRLDEPTASGATYTKKVPGGDRWGRYKHRRWGARLGLAMEGEDVDREMPAGTAGFDADPVELQDYLATKVRTGDPVTLRRRVEPVGDDSPVPGYTIEHGGRPIGVVSPVFRQALRRYMYGRKENDSRWTWPVTVTDCWIDDIETVAGSEAMGRRAGLGPHGVWLAPRLSGLTWFEYEKRETGTDDE
jgi:hypothetical protein